MKVLVTGGTGFVGSHTARALKEAGHSVRLLVRSQTKTDGIFNKHNIAISEYIISDITDKAIVEKAVQGCDAVIHTAAMVSTAEKYADLVYQTNVVGTQSVIDSALAAGVKKIIYVSSVSALFKLGADTMNEQSDVCVAHNPYGRSKVSSENYVREMQAKGAPIVITYPTGIVGKDDPALSEPHFGLKMFVSQFTFTSSAGMQLVNVEDLAKAHVTILEKVDGADRFVLGGHYYSWKTLLETTNKVTGRQLLYVHIPGNILRFIGRCADIVTSFTGKELPLTGEGMVYATQWILADSSKAEKELGIKFTDPDQTLADVYRYLYEQGNITAKKAGVLAYS